MLELISAGGKKLEKFFKDIWKKIVEWFRRNKEFIEPKYEKVANISARELDWMASRKIGNLGGYVLKRTQIRKLRGILKQKGIVLIVEGDKKQVTKLFKSFDGFDTFESLLRFMYSKKPPAVGGFNAHTKQFYLIKDVTEIVAFHKMCHLKHFQEVGEMAYKSLTKLDKEMYVWKQILANREKWTRAELKESLRYINDIRTNPKYGYNLKPIKIK